MRDWFRGIDWVLECRDLDVNEMWNKFCSFIDPAINMFVPLGHNKSMKTPRWMNKAANSAIGSINLECGIDIDNLKPIMI